MIIAAQGDVFGDLGVIGDQPATISGVLVLMIDRFACTGGDLWGESIGYVYLCKQG